MHSFGLSAVDDAAMSLTNEGTNNKLRQTYAEVLLQIARNLATIVYQGREQHQRGGGCIFPASAVRFLTVLMNITFRVQAEFQQFIFQFIFPHPWPQLFKGWATLTTTE